MNMRQKSASVPNPIGNNGVKRMSDTAINARKKRRTLINTQCAIDTRSAAAYIERCSIIFTAFRQAFPEGAENKLREGERRTDANS